MRTGYDEVRLLLPGILLVGKAGVLPCSSASSPHYSMTDSDPSSCGLQIFSSVIEQFTLFATISVSINGMGFFPASKDLFGLIKRNLGTVVNFWGMPNFVLLITILLFSLSWACLVFIVTFLNWRDEYPSASVTKLALAVSGVSFAVVGFILYFIATIVVRAVVAVQACCSIQQIINDNWFVLYCTVLYRSWTAATPSSSST